jgi:cytochrome c oxidase subunit 1
MAITETSTNEPATAAGPAPEAVTGFAVPEPRGIAGVLGSGDHKTLGRLYIGFSLAFGLGALAVLAWFNVQASVDAGSQAADRALLTFTFAALTLVLGFVLPLFVGLATVVVPLQVGAATIAFPRAAAAGLWTWLLSMVLLAVSYLPPVGGGVGGTKVDGLLLTYLGLIGAVLGLLLGTVAVLTTIVAMRPPGLGLDRVPLFSWAFLVAGGLWLLTLPALVANAALIFVDVKWGAPSLFGVSDNQWAQLAWIISPPQVFAYAIPLLGIAGDAVATFAKGTDTVAAGTARRLPRRSVLLVAIGAFGALSFGAYAQPLFNPEAWHELPFIAQGFVLILPLLAVIGGYATALRRGTSSTGSPLGLGLVAVVILLLAAVAAAVFAVGPLELQRTSAQLIRNVPAFRTTTAGIPIYLWGVFLMVAVAAATGAVAGLFQWSSKITGRQLPDGLGKALAPALLVGALLAGGPYLVLGFATKADGLADATPALALLSLVGVGLTLAVLAVALLLTLTSRLGVIRGVGHAEADAWGTGATLEWATDSPPAPGNFGELPLIISPEPLLDTAPVAEGQDSGGPR